MRPSFYPVENFITLGTLTSNWRIIRDEYLSLNAPTLPIDRVNKDHAAVHAEVMDHIGGGGHYGWLMGWGNDGGKNPDWTQYALTIFDDVIPFAMEAMPQTTELLKKIGGIKTSALLKMKPHTILAAHRHEEMQADGVLLFHLTVDVAENSYSYLNVNGEFKRYALGDAVVFDGSLDHFSFNASDSERTILYIEFDMKQMSVG